MSRLTSVALAAVAALPFAAPGAAAQWNVARFEGEAERSRVYTTFGLDPAFVGAVGYGRVIPVAGHRVQISGDAGVATARIDARDFRARIGVQTSIAHWRSLHLTGSATFITRGTENTVYRGLNFGADVTGAAGLYRPRWFAVGEFGKDKAIVTHVTHSDWYRTHFHAGAKDGWYLDAGGTYHYGAAGGVTLGRTEVVARAGWHRTERFNALVAPVYANVGVGYAF